MDLPRSAITSWPSLNSWTGLLTIISILTFGTYLWTTLLFLVGSLGDRRHKGKQPLTLPYWIPFLGSAITMSSDGHGFYETAIRKSHGGVVGARLGPMYVYFVTGAKNVQAIFRNSKSLSTDAMVLQVYKNVLSLPKPDIAIFEADKSGSAVDPLISIPEHERIWRNLHHINGHGLQSSVDLGILTNTFTREILDVMNQQPLETTVSIYTFFRNQMSTAAGITIIGRGAFVQNPKMTEDFWEFSAGFMTLFFGIPRFLSPKVFEARDRLVEACVKTINKTAGRWDAILAADEDWNEEFGSRLNRDREKAMIESGLSIEGRGAMMAGFLIGINGNAIPIASWIIIEAVRDPELMNSLREEIMTTVVHNRDKPQDFELDIPKLLALPLLSSVMTETLRLRMSTTPTRELLSDLVVDGYVLKAGNSVMVPSWLAHSEESWSKPDHPSTSFWARRFLDPKDGTGKPTTSSQPGKYFPFGGGSTMCPGRFFAKQEVLAAVAVMIAKFDIQFLQNVHFDGKPSDRTPMPDTKNAGAGALLPDGDMMVRLRKRM